MYEVEQAINRSGNPPKRAQQCPCCNQPIVPGPFTVQEQTWDTEDAGKVLMIVVGYYAGSEFYSASWQVAEIPGEWTHEDSLRECQSLVSDWNLIAGGR
jgi:hypothetical protein